MAFLIDTDICSAYLKGTRQLYGPFQMYGGGLYLSTVTLAELWSWLLRKRASERHLDSLQDLLKYATILPVDVAVASRSGQERARLFDAGKPTPVADMLIAGTALVHNLTVVTHNVDHYRVVPDLRIVDWLAEN